ncbi:hypothetical protein C7S20_00525 [Christiangramia fulva]|uniref:Uncharacterized protein n=1 Tax=Christiangramia fulva TaxID=2126553 RepID=A0A2R3Z0W9_9FLAO|nr:hypothetical protein [Christiangramia fulva]AVR43878.1 hypothetical protein C7S20_00525 [Christiangramia fulva]
MNLKRNLLKKKILKLSREAGKSELGKPKELGFVFEGISSEGIIEFIKGFKDQGWNEKQMEIIICDPQEALPRGVEAETLEMENISLSGKLKQEIELHFVKHNYDFLIGYFSEKSLPAALVFAMTAAGFKMGRKPDVFNLFDVEISANDPKVFLEESLKYLQILKAKN